ncbi:DoxX family membrane protein [Dawidia soli]|uniref:DoxX family membrane protein n=1 Tax=Dawidia soli TaxID=2782352 RepID=A0AAP2DEM2_9BACT|nr:DoxX family membrane protein [Dawidia soli]MBT1690766.1 DoxX family membrane protein [Dawidia soli]
MQQLLLRLALSATFLSAVASRLSLWGARSGGWKNFLDYTAQTCSWAPAGWIPFLAVTATALEITFALLLFVGYQTPWAALGSAVLTFLFAVSMAYSFGLKEPLDYSVFVFSAAALLLASLKDFPWSIDQLLTH